MMAWTSPARTSRLTPFSVSLPATRALKSVILSKIFPLKPLADGAFQTHAQQVLRLDRELHRKFLEHHFAKSTDDHVDRVFGRDAALQAIEQLVLADFGGAGLVLDGRSRILDFHIGKRVRRAFRTHQQRIALGKIARALGARRVFTRAAVGFSAMTRRDPFGNNGALGIAAYVDHFGAGVRLLIIVRDRNRITLADRILALQNAARVFPGD